MTLKKKSWLSVALFILIFGGLLLTATFTDLQVSKILTAHALEPGKYLSNDAFGVAFEAVGSTPVYMILAFAFQIMFWYILRNCKNKVLSALAGIFTLVASTAAYYVGFDDVMKYIFEHSGDETTHDMGYYVGIILFLSLAATGFATLAVRNFSDESTKKLFGFAIAVVCVVAVANIFIAAVKSPVGRMRYRAMNCDGGQKIGGFDNFTRWYVVNGKNHGYSKPELLEIFGTTDACRSFPSGHTNAAGMSYMLIMLSDALGIKDKRKKAAMWIIPLLFTGTVAVSRIVVGAHYFSDVLVGGTTAFVSMIIFREIFVCKFSHLKAMFSK